MELIDRNKWYLASPSGPSRTSFILSDLCELPHHFYSVKTLLRGGGGKLRGGLGLPGDGLRSPLNQEACFGDPGWVPPQRQHLKLARQRS